MTDKPLDVDGAITRVFRAIDEALSEPPEQDPDAVSAEGLAQRRAWLQAVMAATEKLLSHRDDQTRRASDMMFCAIAIVEMIGAAVGSSHLKFCQGCFARHSQTLMQHFYDAMVEEIEQQSATIEGAPARAAAH